MVESSPNPAPNRVEPSLTETRDLLGCDLTEMVPELTELVGDLTESGDLTGGRGRPTIETCQGSCQIMYYMHHKGPRPFLQYGQ